MKIFSPYTSARVQAIGPDDNVFDAGIDSLDILQIMLDIERKLKARVQFPDLLTHPTIRGLAAFIENGSRGRCVAKLREGEGKPLVLVFDASRDIVSYRRLLAALDPGYPVFGVSAAFIPPGASLEEYAGLLTEMLAAQDGFETCDLAGYSSGGIVALEIARQLGENAGHVFLIDTPNYKIYPKLMNFRFIFGNTLRISASYGLKGVLAYIRNYFSEFRQKINIVAERGKLIKMIRGYEPKAPAAHALLFTTDETEARTDGALGWRTLIRDDMIIHLGGRHVSVMKNRVSKIARHIESARANETIDAKRSQGR